MARKTRIHYVGAVYHVILRGNAGNPVFLEDRDRYRLYLILQYAVEKFNCRIHGFCLMSNHIHLIVQTSDIPLSRIMQNVSLRYTKWINYTQRRTGHVFQGRYKALLVDADQYLLELIRYIHLNPVRAGAARTPDEWLWTGHHAYAGKEYHPWLTTDWVLSMLAKEATNAREKYISFVDDGIGEERRLEFHTGSCDGRLLGDDNFVDGVLQKAGEARSRVTEGDVIDSVCAVYKCSPAELRAPGKTRPLTEARAMASLLVQESQQLSLTRLGKLLNRDIAPLGRVGRRLQDAISEDSRLMKLVEDVRECVSKMAERLT